MVKTRLISAILLMLVPAALSGQAPVKGDAILKHPIGVLAAKSVDIIAAGKIDEYASLRTKSDQDDWKKQSAAEKKAFGDRLKDMAPSAALFADLVRKAGELIIDGSSATLAATTPAGTMRQVFEREGGLWRVSFGPVYIADRPPATKIEGPALSRHPAIAVVLQYADLIQANKIEEAMAQVGSTKAQADWKAQPASEKRESAAFRKRLVPGRAELAKLIASGGVLLVEGDTATLNVIKMEPATAAKSAGSSTTIAIPFVLEKGAWKIAQ